MNNGRQLSLLYIRLLADKAVLCSIILVTTVADKFEYSCFLGILASITDGSWDAL